MKTHVSAAARKLINDEIQRLGGEITSTQALLTEQSNRAAETQRTLDSIKARRESLIVFRNEAFPGKE